MKWIIVITVLLSVYSQTLLAKTVEEFKTPIKKAKSLKPTKSPKSIVDQFKNLNSEDQAFIKELDKQFSLHGDKLKLKVERENASKNGAANKKRTIDGELGFSYDQNHYEHGFYFSKPQYVSHKGFNSPGHRYTHTPVKEIVTDIEIQPSHSYELKPVVEHAQDTKSHYIRQMHTYTDDNVPVIVLKIPGPSKYAAHLQSLLQQYLELRAAQYIREFEEQESLGYSHYGHSGPEQHYNPHPYQAPDPYLYHMVPVAPSSIYRPSSHHESNYYSSEAYTPSYYDYPSHSSHNSHSASLPSSHSASLPSSHSYSAPQEYHPQYTQTPASVQISHRNPKAYFNQDTSYDHHANQFSQYDYSYNDHHTHEAIQEQAPSEIHDETHHESHESSLKTSENYPSDKHTRVIFKEDKLPYTPSYEPKVEYARKDEHVEASTAVPSVVEITQRSATAPQTFSHSHPTIASEASNQKKMTAPYTEEAFRQYNKLIQRMKKQNLSVEPRNMPEHNNQHQQQQQQQHSQQHQQQPQQQQHSS